METLDPSLPANNFMMATASQSGHQNEASFTDLLFRNENVKFELIDDNDVITKDRELHDAVKQSAKEGSVMPILKKELKCKILSRRMTHGEPDLKISFDPPKSYPLTPEEEIKNEIRRQRNRRSATKSRDVRKRREVALDNECKQLQEENEKLIIEVNALSRLKTTLHKTFQTHSCSCRKLQPSPTVTKHKDTVAGTVVPSTNQNVLSIPGTSQSRALPVNGQESVTRTNAETANMTMTDKMSPVRNVEYWKAYLTGHHDNIRVAS